MIFNKLSLILICFLITATQLILNSDNKLYGAEDSPEKKLRCDQVFKNRYNTPDTIDTMEQWQKFVETHHSEFTIQYPPRREYFHSNFKTAPIPFELDEGSPILLYVHVPFCEKKCYFCNFAVDIRNKPQIYSSYVDSLILELERFIPLLNGREVRGIDIGGGTPTRLPIEQLERLIKAITPLKQSSKHEFPLSIETTPTIASESPDLIKSIGDLGVDRISMGVQSFNEEHLSMVNRAIHLGKNEQAARVIRNQKFKRFNVDLIFGLPGQSETIWQSDLDRAIALEPDSITTYDCLYRGKGRVLTNRTNEIPTSEQYGHLYDIAYHKLRAHGYFANYGSVNFSRYSEETGTSAYFEGRLLDGLPYLGIGNYASSWNGDYWFFNVYAVNKYLELMFAGESPVGDFYRLPPEEQYAKYILYSLNYGIIDSKRFLNRFGTDFNEYFKKELELAESKKWLYRSEDTWKITEGEFRSINYIRGLFYSIQARDFLYGL